MTVLTFALKSLVLKIVIASIKRFIFKVPKVWGKNETRTFLVTYLPLLRKLCEYLTETKLDEAAVAWFLNLIQNDTAWNLIYGTATLYEAAPMKEERARILERLRRRMFTNDIQFETMSDTNLNDLDQILQIVTFFKKFK
jgi:hypothetical protein